MSLFYDFFSLLEFYNANTSVLGIYLLYFILALDLYMFLFVTFGSTVLKVEDMSASVVPVTLFMIFELLKKFL